MNRAPSCAPCTAQAPAWRDQVGLLEENNPAAGCSSHGLAPDGERPFWTSNSALQLWSGLTRRCLQDPNAVCPNTSVSKEKQPAKEPQNAVLGSVSAEVSRACRSRRGEKSDCLLGGATRNASYFRTMGFPGSSSSTGLV